MHSGHLLSGRIKVKDQDWGQIPPCEEIPGLASQVPNRNAPQLHNKGYPEKRIEEINRAVNTPQRSMSDPTTRTFGNEDGDEYCQSSMDYRRSVPRERRSRTVVPPHQDLRRATTSMDNYHFGQNAPTSIGPNHGDRQSQPVQHHDNGLGYGNWGSSNANSQHGYLWSAQITSRNDLPNIGDDDVSPRTSTYRTRPSLSRNRDDGSNNHAFAPPLNMHRYRYDPSQQVHSQGAYGYSSRPEKNSISRYPSSVHSAPGTHNFPGGTDGVGSSQDNEYEQKLRRDENEWWEERLVDSTTMARRNSDSSIDGTASSSESIYSQATSSYPQDELCPNIDLPSINLQKSFQDLQDQSQFEDPYAFTYEVNVWPDDSPRSGCPKKLQRMILFDTGCRGSNWVAESIIRALGGDLIPLRRPEKFMGFNGEPMNSSYKTCLNFRTIDGVQTWRADFLVSPIENPPFDMVLGAGDCIRFGILTPPALSGGLVAASQNKVDRRRLSENEARHAKEREEHERYNQRIKERVALEEKKRRRERERRRMEEERKEERRR